MTFLYCFLSFACGFVLGVLTVSIAVMGSDKSKREKQLQADGLQNTTTKRL